MKQIRQAMLRWSPVPWFGTSFDYNPSLVEELKGFQPRAWDAQTKTWWFPDTFLPHVRGLLMGAHPGREIPMLSRLGLSYMAYRRADDHYDSVPHEHYNDERLYWAYDKIGVALEVPDVVLDAAYYAMRYHFDPDRNLGGSTEPLIALDEAYETICTSRGRKLVRAS